MSTDYCALCAELADALDSSNGFLNSDGEWVVPEPIGTIVDRARAALAQPEPVGPTDEELETTARAAEIQYMKEHGGLTAATPDGIHAQLQAQRLAGLRAVLARWGQPTTPETTDEQP